MYKSLRISDGHDENLLYSLILFVLRMLVNLSGCCLKWVFMYRLSAFTFDKGDTFGNGDDG